MVDAASRQSSASYDTEPALIRIRRIGIIAIVATAGVACLQRPAPALSGRGLGITTAIVVLLASATALAPRAHKSVTVAALAALICGSAVLVSLQPGGTGDVGLFVAVAVAAIRLADRDALVALALTVGAGLCAGFAAERSSGAVVGTLLGVVAFYLVARFARRAAEAHAQTRQLLAELHARRDTEAEAAMLRERSRLARDMHDVLAHSLSGLMLQLEGARMLAAHSDAHGQLPPALDRAHHLARAGLDEARRAIGALRDDQLPGPDRLEQLRHDFENDSHIPTSLQVRGTQRPLDSEASLTIYRVAQEALTNIRRHAHPEQVQLDLTYAPEGMHLMVRDWAQGARPSENVPLLAGGGGYGLTGMRERAALLGGTLEAGPTDDGFRVELWIPS